MSHTSMYVIETDGELAEFATYKNGHGSGPQVWSHLAFKYLPNVVDPGAQDFSIGPRHWCTDNTVLTDLYKLANAREMEEFEWRTALVCAAYVIVKPEHILRYADALAKFAEVYGPRCEGQAFSIGEQAADLRRVHEEIPENRGVCWRQTSVGDEWDNGSMNDARRVILMTKKLEDSGLTQDQIGEVVQALDDWSYDEHVPYNIDLDEGHEWLPE